MADRSSRWYPALERPLVEVELDGVWYRGWLLHRAWFDGCWHSTVDFWAGRVHHQWSVPASRIRVLDHPDRDPPADSGGRPVGS